MPSKPGLWYLLNLRLFERAPRAALESMSGEVRARKFAKRETLSFDERCESVGAIAIGSAKLYRPSLFGRLVVEAMLYQGDLFGCIAGREKAAARQTLEMLEPTTVLFIPRTALSKLIHANSDFAYSVVQMLEDRQRTLERRLQSLAFKDVRHRVIETIVDLARVYGDKCEHGWAVDVRITQQDLADLVGATRQAVSKVLRELELKCYLSRKKRLICIVSLKRLARLSEKLSTTGDKDIDLDPTPAHA